LAWALRFEL
jgi:hypothetical protein